MFISHVSQEPIFLTFVSLTGVLDQHADVADLLGFFYLLNIKKILLTQYAGR